MRIAMGVLVVGILVFFGLLWRERNPLLSWGMLGIAALRSFVVVMQVRAARESRRRAEDEARAEAESKAAQANLREALAERERQEEAERAAKAGEGT
jgi:hypothetical protein